MCFRWELITEEYSDTHGYINGQYNFEDIPIGQFGDNDVIYPGEFPSFLLEPHDQC